MRDFFRALRCAWLAAYDAWYRERNRQRKRYLFKDGNWY